jgi:hypothetical protein
MFLTIRPQLPATFALLTLLASAEPAYAATHRGPHSPHRAPHRLSIAQRLDLYSPRVRRATITYLRLRLLELREEDLDRARLAIERRLSIDDLLTPPRRARPEFDDRPRPARRPSDQDGPGGG